MALTKEQIDLEAKRLDLVNQIGELKKQAADVKTKYDQLTMRLNLEHKIKGLSPEELVILKSM